MVKKTLFPLLAGKFTNAIIKEFNLGSGSTWPGHVALSINRTFLKDFLKNKKLKVVLVAGTNGKTTTTKILRHVLEENGHKIFQNEEGANLVNGLATSLLRKATIWGAIREDVAIFEVDENNLPHVLKQITPDTIIFLNLFRDQLDRYGEVHTIAEKWKKSLGTLSKSTRVVLNADDPEILYLHKSVSDQTFFFSIPETHFINKKISNDTDSTHCPECQTKLQFSKIAYSHIGKFICPKCGFSNKSINESISSGYSPILAGTYNMYNQQAAVTVANELFGISHDNIKKSLETFTPAFGRQETIQYKKRQFLMLLSKNPAGFNQSLSVVTQSANKSAVLLALNDRIPDGQDVSWIWDVDFEDMVHNTNKIIITGDRCFDLALRLKYSDSNGKREMENGKFSQNIIIEPNNTKAIEQLIKLTDQNETAYILPTYSAMLELRKILTGKEIL